MDWTKYSDFKLLMACVYGESSGEGVLGQMAVAMVIRNRVTEGKYGMGYRGVILKPYQFSSFNKGSVRIPKMKEFICYGRPETLYNQIYWIAKGVQADFIKDDITFGSNHFLTVDLFVSDNRPSWADSSKVMATIGNHVFLKL